MKSPGTRVKWQELLHCRAMEWHLYYTSRNIMITCHRILSISRDIQSILSFQLLLVFISVRTCHWASAWFHTDSLGFSIVFIRFPTWTSALNQVFHSLGTAAPHPSYSNEITALNWGCDKLWRIPTRKHTKTRWDFNQLRLFPAAKCCVLLWWGVAMPSIERWSKRKGFSIKRLTGIISACLLTKPAVLENFSSEGQ